MARTSRTTQPVRHIGLRTLREVFACATQGVQLAQDALVEDGSRQCVFTVKRDRTKHCEDGWRLDGGEQLPERLLAQRTKGCNGSDSFHWAVTWWGGEQVIGVAFDPMASSLQNL